jgi:hypothetical protein
MKGAGITALADAIGRGFVAGLLGTAAVTLSSTIEMKLRGRSGSKVPAQAICKALGLEATSEEAQQRLNNLVHWGYGTAWGAVRGLVAAAGLRGVPATLIHFGMIWGAEQLTLPKVGVAPPITQQQSEEIAIDAWHHFVYAETTGAAYDRIFGSQPNKMDKR